MTRLLMLPPAPVIAKSHNQVCLDVKFVEGMKYSAKKWSGEIDCILRTGTNNIPFGAVYNNEDLPFNIEIRDESYKINKELISNYDVVLCSGDRHQDFYLADLSGLVQAQIVFVVEYTLETRLQIVALDRDRSLLRRVWSGLWNIRQEMLRRRAFRRADALQANGYPAHALYKPLNPNTLLYLDNRMKPGMFATQDEMAERRRHLTGGGALRLINSGRLEPMKGTQDLVRVAMALRNKGVDFTLDIYGAGSLETEIRNRIAAEDLAAHVRLHAPVDFETELVPRSREQADIFVSCHRQSDPSCTYLEAMGCGLPIAGYGNRMLSGLLDRVSAGWTARLGDPEALADKIAGMASNHPDIFAAADAALAFAREHGFQSEFSKRNTHLETLAAKA